MNVAKLELCKRLYELSGWDDTGFGYQDKGKSFTPTLVPTYDDNIAYDYPAYSAGYLLRKLPKETAHNNVLALITEWEDSFYCGYAERNNEGDYTIDSAFYKSCERADTPEDALCLLAIKLFEEGILK